MHAKNITSCSRAGLSHLTQEPSHLTSIQWFVYAWSCHSAHDILEINIIQPKVSLARPPIHSVILVQPLTEINKVREAYSHPAILNQKCSPWFFRRVTQKMIMTLVYTLFFLTPSNGDFLAYHLFSAADFVSSSSALVHLTPGLLKEFQTQRPATTGQRAPALEQRPGPSRPILSPFTLHEPLSLFIMLTNFHSIIWFS